MGRIATCAACQMIKAGVKSRIPLTHTCGKDIGGVVNNLMDRKFIRPNLCVGCRSEEQGLQTGPFYHSCKEKRHLNTPEPEDPEDDGTASFAWGMLEMFHAMEDAPNYIEGIDPTIGSLLGIYGYDFDEKSMPVPFWLSSFYRYLRPLFPEERLSDVMLANVIISHYEHVETDGVKNTYLIIKYLLQKNEPDSFKELYDMFLQGGGGKAEMYNTETKVGLFLEFSYQYFLRHKYKYNLQ